MDSARNPGARRFTSLAAACALFAIAAPLAVTALLVLSNPVRADEPTPEPVRLPPIVELTVGSQHACVIVDGGEVWCWGFASDGALGAGPEVTSSDRPVRATLPRPAVAIDAGIEGTCAITDDGAAWCWGRNGSGEVGDGTLENRFVPTRVTGLDRPAVSISRGHDHACAVLDDGSAWCWGDNSVSQLGTSRLPGSHATESRPVRVPGVAPLAAISAGAGFTCALTRADAAVCWGTDLYDEVGRGDDSDSYVPGPAAGLDGEVDRVVAGDDRACAIRDGVLLCWGLMNPEAPAGDRAAAIQEVPEPVALGSAPVVDVAVSNGYHLCALDADGVTWCWGNAEARQLGPSVADRLSWVSEPVRQDLPAASAIDTGYDFSCALFAPDDLRCWGDGDAVARNPWTGETGPSSGGFREPGPLVPTVTTYIPTPRDVSTDPPVVGANLLLAAFVMILFTIAGELLNRTLAENEDALAARGGALARVRRFRARFDAAMARRLGRGRRLAAVQLAGIAAIYGLVFSLLDRTWDPFSITGIWLFLSMAVAFGVVGIADDLACWSVARRWGVAADLDLRPGNLLVAVTSTFASRVAFLVPGVMIGMPEALEVDADALDARRRSRLAAVGLGTLVIIGAVAWAITLGTSAAGSSGDEGLAVLLGGIEAFFLVVFAVTVQNGFAQLLAFRGTPGRTLRTSHRWLWLTGLLAVTFLFWHTLVNPRGDLATALRETNVVAFVATAVGFVLFAAAVSLWSAMRRRRSGARAGALAVASPASALVLDAPPEGPSSPAPPPGVPARPPAAATAAVPLMAALPAAMAEPTAPASAVVPLRTATFSAAGAVGVATREEIAVEAVPIEPVASPTAAPIAPSPPVPLSPPAPPPVVVECPPAPPSAGRVVAATPPSFPGWVEPGPAVGPAPPSGAPAPSSEPGVEFDVVAIGHRRLTGAVRLDLRPDGVGLVGSWVRRDADRAFRVVNAIVLTLLVVGLLGLALLTTVPGFRFYRVPWLVPSSAVALAVLCGVDLVAKLWRNRRRWRGEVRVTAGMLVSVRTAFDRGPLVAACILLTPIGGAVYAAIVGPKVVRLRGPFDPERTTAVEVRLKCADRDEAADIAARVAAIRGAAMSATGGWR